MYEWERPEVEALLRDLVANLDAKESCADLEVRMSRGADALYSTHFCAARTQPYNLGMVTLKRCTTVATDKRHDIVDGQQRLTTLSLVLAAVRQYVKDQSAKGVVQVCALHAWRRADAARARVDELEIALQQKASSIYGRLAGPRVVVWTEATAAYARILEAKEPIDWTDASYARLLTSNAAKRMKDSVECVLEFLQDINDDALVTQLSQYILLKTEFTVSSTTDQALAVQVFRSQTGRGKARVETCACHMRVPHACAASACRTRLQHAYARVHNMRR